MGIAEIISLIGAFAAFITAIATLAASIMSNKKTIALIEYKLDENKKEMEIVKEHLSEHNGYAAKFADASKDIALIQKDIEYLRKEKQS